MISETILIGFLYFREILDRGFLFLCNTFLLHSLSPYSQTDRGTNTLASHGLEEPFFLVVLYVVSVFGSGGKKVLVYICMYYFREQYKCGGVLVFWLQ